MPEHSPSSPKPPLNSNAKILIFDSGVGGLSILQEVHKLVPHCSLQFVSDNAGFPYGTRSEGDLIDRVMHVMDRCLKTLSPDIVVIACNSASTVVLPTLRERYSIPFVGVVPAIKPAAELSKSKHIGILATPATIDRTYTSQLIDEFAPHCRVSRVGSSELVYEAERKLRGNPVDHKLLSSVLAPFFEQVESGTSGSGGNRGNRGAVIIDTIVLACTHFPLLVDELAEASPVPINWIDSGEAIARRVRSLLETHHGADVTPEEEQPKPIHSIWTTSDDGAAERMENFIQALGGADKGVLNI